MKEFGTAAAGDVKDWQDQDSLEQQQAPVDERTQTAVQFHVAPARLLLYLNQGSKRLMPLLLQIASGSLSFKA
jgi:hypothetical protein